MSKQVLQGPPKCGNCRFYSQGWCGCMFGQHEEEMREPEDTPCGDWAPPDATMGVLANGTIWEYRR